MTDQLASDEPITIAEDVLDRGHGQEIVTVEQKYTPRLDGTDDPTEAYDTSMARSIMEVLVEQYYGYDWYVLAESRQGIVAFSIPDLMGPTLMQVIRLQEHLSKKMVLDAAGQMLERMGLRRGRKDAGEYAAAKLRRHTFDFADVKH